MTYTFKPLPELFYGVLTAVAVVVLSELVSLNPDAITDWQQWAVALGVGSVRAAAAIALNWVRASLTPDTQPHG